MSTSYLRILPSTPVLTIKDGMIAEVLATLEAEAADKFFTVQQDLFIVKQRCMLPHTYASDEEFVQGFRKAFGEDWSIEQLQRRFEQLLNMPQKRTLLRTYLNALLHVNKGRSIKEFLDRQYKYILSDTSMAQDVLDNISSKNVINDDVETIEVEISGKYFKKVKMFEH